MKKARILAGLWMGLACAQVQAANEWWCVCDGNWFTATNWCPPHVPVGADTMYIDNGCGGPLIQQGNAVGGIVYVGFDTAGNTLEQRGLQANSLTVTGELHLGESEGSSGTYKLSGVGQLTVQGGTEYIGRNGNGAFVQSGGKNEVTGGTRLLVVGDSPTSAGTYELSGGQDVRVTAGDLHLGFTGGSGVFLQTGGTATFGNGVSVGDTGIGGNSCRYELGGTGILTTQNLHVQSGASAEPNRFIQSGDSSATVGFRLSVVADHDGETPPSYEMSGGQLTLGPGVEYCDLMVFGGCEGCPGGVARFVQSGGTVMIHCHTTDPTGDLKIGFGSDGRYELSGTGQLTTAGTEVLGVGSKGTFVQTGGRHTVTDMLSVGYEGIGRYELAGTAELQASNEIVGRGASGDFIQTGGTNTVQSFLYLGYTPAVTGKYEISGGTLSALKLWVGYQGNGEFYQSNGTVTADNLELGRESGSIGLADLSGTGVMAIGAVSVGRTGAGTFTLNGGTLMADTLVVGRFSGTGGLEILNPSAQITIGKELTLGAKGSFSAEPGSAIHMTHDAGGTVAAKFDNFRKVSSNVPGLANLELSFEGGADLTATAELAGRDLGAVEAGFVSNFALGTLRVGASEASAHVQLVEANDNGKRGGPGGAAEALYACTIAIGPGAILDVGPFHGYYRSLWVADGGTITMTGGSLRQVGLDYDADSDVDLEDFGALQRCFSGSQDEPDYVAPSSSCLQVFDQDCDGDIDANDYRTFWARVRTD